MEEESDSGQISRSDQRSYIKIETLRGKNPTEIHNALYEVCGDSLVIATDRVPPGSTVTAAYYRKFLQDVLRPKICQKRSAMFAAGVLILHNKAQLQPQVQYRKFWKSMNGESFPTCRTVLTRAHQTLTCSKNWRNHSVGKCFRSVEKVSNEVTQVIRPINNRNTRFAKTLDCCDKAHGDYIEGL